MDAEIVRRVRAEEADLVRKLQAVRALLAAYGDESMHAPVQATAPRVQAPPALREKVPISSFTTSTRTSVVLAMEALARSGGRMKTRALVEYIEGKGHEITGQNKVNALGALLARSADIEGYGKSGWELVDAQQAEVIIAKYAPKENEASSEPTEDASEVDGLDEPTSEPSRSNLPPWRRA